MIKQDFKDSTIITIAHRLNTIINYDRIMVFDDGKLVEFDRPKTLLNNKESLLYNLVMQNGSDYYQKLYDMIDK